MMTKRFLFNWCIWIGLATGIYTALYVMSPLNQYGVVYATFVALPIFFLSGAKRGEFLNYSLSNIVGVVWGWVYITGIIWMTGMGFSNVVSQGLVCGIVTIICCSFHFIVTPNTYFNKLPAMFGGIAMAFSTSATKIIPLMITLALGSTLALICQEGTHLLTDDGHWKLLQKKILHFKNLDRD